MTGSQRVRAVQTYFTAERFKRSLNHQQDGAFKDAVLKTIFSFTFGKFQLLNVSAVVSVDHTACFPHKHELLSSILDLWEFFRAQLAEST